MSLVLWVGEWENYALRVALKQVHAGKVLQQHQGLRITHWNMASVSFCSKSLRSSAS